MNKKTILVAAGGTGGHVFPGIAVAHEFQKRHYCVEWLGTKDGLESRLVPVNGIKLHFFPVQGVRGKNAITMLLSPIKVFLSIIKAYQELIRINPALVIGMGGFVAGPVGVAALFRRTPLVIHEQNAVAGTTNRLLSRIAKKVLCAFPVNLERAEVIGNPVRISLEKMSATKADELDNKEYSTDQKKKINVLVLGGSRGSRALNLKLPQAFAMSSKSGDIYIRHQCGRGREQEAKRAYAETALDVDVFSFMDDMDEMMMWADLIVCRAGALTVSEIAIVGLPSVLIPYPYAIDDHQTANAKYLESAGAAYIVQETEFDSGKLEKAIDSILGDDAKRKKMSRNAKRVAKPGASLRFVDICEGLI